MKGGRAEIRTVFQQTTEGFFSSLSLPLQLLFLDSLLCFLLSPFLSFVLSRVVRESSISGSCKTHLITAAFPHLLPLNHSPFRYFIRLLIHLLTSHRLPHHYVCLTLCHPDLWCFCCCVQQHTFVFFLFCHPLFTASRHPDLSSLSLTQSPPVLQLLRSDKTSDVQSQK